MRDRKREAIHRKVADDTIEHLITATSPTPLPPTPTPLSMELMKIRQDVRSKRITGMQAIHQAIHLAIPTPVVEKKLPSEPPPEWEHIDKEENLIG